jgi:hypothetical protein
MGLGVAHMVEHLPTSEAPSLVQQKIINKNFFLN